MKTTDGANLKTFKEFHAINSESDSDDNSSDCGSGNSTFAGFTSEYINIPYCIYPKDFQRQKMPSALNNYLNLLFDVIASWVFSTRFT